MLRADPAGGCPGLLAATRATPRRGRPVLETAVPRASRYDLAWADAHSLGENVLLFAESLCRVLPLQPGMRVLDLGCGHALSSIFLAREFDVTVWAVDRG